MPDTLLDTGDTNKNNALNNLNKELTGKFRGRLQTGGYSLAW